MIVKVKGKLVEKRDHAVTIEADGLFYEVVVPMSVMHRLEQSIDADGNVSLITYHYFQIEPSRGLPVLIGFMNEVEKDFFLQFIKVSGIGPRAAVKALNKPIADVTRAIDDGDISFLKTLPGIGAQKAKDIVARLQGKVGRFGLIQDRGIVESQPAGVPAWQQEALDVLLQLQYKRNEAQDMIQKALQRSKDISSTEDLLNEIYKQRVKG